MAWNVGMRTIVSPPDSEPKVWEDEAVKRADTMEEAGLTIMAFLDSSESTQDFVRLGGRIQFILEEV